MKDYKNYRSYRQFNQVMDIITGVITVAFGIAVTWWYLILLTN